MELEYLLNAALDGAGVTEEDSRQLAAEVDTAGLMQVARQIRDRGHGDTVSYSRKVFLPLTHLCRDVCHYCTFAQTPRHLDTPYMPLGKVLEVAREGDAMGCHEALLTLGEKPELRYSVAREALKELSCKTTLEYVARVAEAILAETGLLPHINAGCMTEQEINMLRPVSASMGIMLESASERLCAKGGPHYGSPDKLPARRLETIALAGKLNVPFTSGILIGIGETRLERVESLLALRSLHERYGHIQEIIVQNFKAKPDTLMASAPEPDLNELLWTLAVTRILFGPTMSVQAPPNLSPGVLPQLVDAGIDDWGGVSPLTPDYVNPEAPWPHVEKLTKETRVAGKTLQPRLTIYPRFARDYKRWLDEGLHTRLLRQIDGEGFPRTDDWVAGQSVDAPEQAIKLLGQGGSSTPSGAVRRVLDRAVAGERLEESEIELLFRSRGEDFSAVCHQADQLRQEVCGDSVSYVVNRNINYTNICYFKCRFCAFSKGKLSENLRGRPYNLSMDEIVRRSEEAWQRGATEVCLQGGIHPDYSGDHYLGVCRAIREALPDIHIHAFSPLEIWQGAATLGLEVDTFLGQLKEAGLNTLPGTAAEILDDEVRAVICADKVNTQQWLEVMEAAHGLGIRTTATIMFGHVDSYRHWARHLLRVRDLQVRSQGFTEFVPLPFVGAEAPLYARGQARNGPTFREALLMHAVARLVLHPHIPNIQASWVKMGQQGGLSCLQAGANDLGGTLMNESITRAAGATHGQELPPLELEQLLAGLGRKVRQRSTLYGVPSAEQQQRSYRAEPLLEPINTPQREFDRIPATTVTELVRNPTPSIALVED